MLESLDISRREKLRKGTHGNALAQENTTLKPQVASDSLSFGDRANLLILSRKDKEHSYPSPTQTWERDLNSTCMVALP